MMKRTIARMSKRPAAALLVLPLLVLAAWARPVPKQSAAGLSLPKDGRAIVASAAATELASDRTDHTAYIYRDHDVTPGNDTLFLMVETPQGNLKRTLEDHGQPLSPEARRVDDLRIHGLMNDANAQQHQRKDAVHDDEQAEQLLKLLPNAFLWSIASENGDLITLDFKPDPNFDPDNMEARVFAAMAGQVVVAKGDNRIRTIKGKLVEDVKIAYGIVGRLHKGGTFQVERREIAPHHWQVTELHVHLEGKVFFKTIGSQEDEHKTDFKPSPALDLKQAYDILMKVP